MPDIYSYFITSVFLTKFVRNIDTVFQGTITSLKPLLLETFVIDFNDYLALLIYNNL